MISSTGFDNLQWFMGIVENNRDMIKQGRVQVRVFGMHSESQEDIPTEALPWAPVLNYGHSGTNAPAEGDWVIGFFIDGRDAQHPVVIGVVPGQNLDLPDNSGNSEKYLKPSRDAFRNYGTPPMPKTMSGEDLETTQLVLQNGTLKNYGSAVKSNGDRSVDPMIEPPVPSASAPWSNMVWKSRNSDSYIQVAEGEEFILVSHESGSHILIDSGGNVKIKSFGDMHQYSEGHSNEGVAGNKSIAIEGQYALKCKDATIEIEGDLNHTIKGNYNLNVGGRMAVSIGQSFEVGAQRMAFEATTEHVNVKAAEKIKLESGDNLSLKSGADGFFSVSGNFNVTATGIYMDADPIHLASGNATASPEAAKSPSVEQPVEQTISGAPTEVISTPGQIGAGDLDDVEDV